MLFIKTGIPIKNTTKMIENKLRDIIRNDILKKSKIIRKHYDIDLKQFLEIVDISLKQYENYAYNGTISSGYAELSNKLDNIISNIKSGEWCCDGRR